MRRSSVLLGCGAVAATAALRGVAIARTRIVDLTPALLPLAGRTDDDAVAAFRSTILVPYRAVYHAVLGVYVEEVGDARIREYLASLAPLRDRLRDQDASMRRDYDALLDTFSTTFPDLAYDRDVYVLPTMYRFDGATRTVARQPTLMFGIDGIVSFYRPGAFSFPVIFDHEFFHVYHQQVLTPRRAEFRGWNPLHLALWSEGLATYVSQRMNPGTSDGVALLDPSLGERSPAEIAQLARLFLEQSRAEAPNEIWFSGGARRDPRVPARAGYLLGLRAAQIIGKDQELAALARLAGPALLARIDATLKALAAGRGAP
jgi:hypothetical protein